MALSPKQIKANTEELAGERRGKGKTAQMAAGLLLPGAGNPHQVSPPALILADDDWLHDMRAEGASPDEETK